jgi:hypothetical protein
MAAFDDRYPAAELRRLDGGFLPGGPRADYQQVIVVVRRGPLLALVSRYGVTEPSALNFEQLFGRSAAEGSRA